jgi:putative Mn2+ efflux pump MntP
MEQLCALLVLLLAANLDTVLLSMNRALAGQALSWQGIGLIALITSGVTALSFGAGELVGLWVTPRWASRLSGALLIGMGLWSMLDWLRQRQADSTEATSPKKTANSTALLALTLGVNNCGIGVGAGLGGYHPLLAGGMNLLITLLALPLGQVLGRRFSGSRLEEEGLLLSGVALVVMGAATLR